MRSEHSPDVSFGTIEFLFAGKAVSLSDIIDQVKKACLNKAHNLTSMLSLKRELFISYLIRKKEASSLSDREIKLSLVFYEKALN